MRTVDPYLHESELQNMIDEVDAEGSGTIDRAQFVSLMSRMKKGVEAAAKRDGLIA